jgi:hypothetical protein
MLAGTFCHRLLDETVHKPPGLIVSRKRPSKQGTGSQASEVCGRTIQSLMRGDKWISSQLRLELLMFACV